AAASGLGEVSDVQRIVLTLASDDAAPATLERISEHLERWLRSDGAQKMLRTAGIAHVAVAPELEEPPFPVPGGRITEAAIAARCAEIAAEPDSATPAPFTPLAPPPGRPVLRPNEAGRYNVDEPRRGR